jgi:predicted MPP superfamily phosphohydrolase
LVSDELVSGWLASHKNPLSILAGAAAGIAAALAVDAFLIEPAWVEVTHHALPLPDLPPSWKGARLVHLTDLHFGAPRTEALFRWMVRTVNDLRPDLVAITGDFILNRASQAEGCAAYISQLRSRHGVVGVLGDHDFRRRRKRPVEGVPEALEAAGMRLLRNETVELAGGLRVAGLDPSTRVVHFGDLNAALKDQNGSAPHLLLAHSPDTILEAAGRGLPMLLCGHTHGGQVVLPFYGPPVTYIRLPNRYASGWSSLDRTRMYTGRGLASHRSLRFLCRPEVAVFELGAG